MNVDKWNGSKNNKKEYLKIYIARNIKTKKNYFNEGY